MRASEIAVVEARHVRGAVVPQGNIREDIAFQNDINTLLALLSSNDNQNPLCALALPVPTQLLTVPANNVQGT